MGVVVDGERVVLHSRTFLRSLERKIRSLELRFDRCLPLSGMQLKAACGFAGENHRSVGRKHVAFKELKFEILFGSHLFHTIDDESFGDFGCEGQLRGGVVTIASGVSGDGEGGICYGVEIEACAGYTMFLVSYRYRG